MNENDKKFGPVIKSINFSNIKTFKEVNINTTPINFFYGNNGSGKTTVVEYLMDDAIKHPDCDYFLFDNNFINNNLQGDKELDGIYTLSEDNIKIQEELKIANKKMEKDIADRDVVRNDVNKLHSDSASLLSDLQVDCWNDTAEARKLFKLAVTGYNGSKDSLTKKLLTVTPDNSIDIKELEKTYNTIFQSKKTTYPLLQKIMPDDFMLNEDNVNTVISIPVNSFAESEYSKYINKIGATDWVKIGKDKFKDKTDNKCPYCKQELPKNFQKDLEDCFNDKYNDEIKLIDTTLSGYSLERTLINNKLVLNSKDNPLGFDFTTYNQLVELLLSQMNANIKIIEDKKKEPSKSFTCMPTQETIDKINILIDEFNIQIENNNSIVRNIDNEKTKCIDNVFKYLRKLSEVSINSYNEKHKKIEDDIKIINDKLNALNTSVKETSDLIDKYIADSRTTKVVYETINNVLKESGFQGFLLDEYTDNDDVTKYKIIRPNSQEVGRLSEGERNFLAFLYFYNKVKNETSKNKKIIIIDDPVTSMDSNSLYIVGALIRDLIEQCSLIFNLDNTLDNSNISQIFIFTHNIAFHNEVVFTSLNNFKYASFFKITKYDNESKINISTAPHPTILNKEINKNPVSTAYNSLWEEYKNTKDPTILMHTIRKIIDHYFIQICGFKPSEIMNTLNDINIKNQFRGENETDLEKIAKLQLAKKMISYLSDYGKINSDCLSDESTTDNDIMIKDTFRILFKILNNEQHYKMMTGEI